MRLLFVYGFEPSGHASAAIALEAAARARGLEAERLNVSEHHRWFGPLVARAYIGLIQRFPGVWRALYDNEKVASVAQAWRTVYLILNNKKLGRTLARLRPDVIVCTHAPPLGALALQKERGRLDCLLAGVITDFKAHTYWIRPGADLYLAPTQAAADGMASRGIPAENIKVTGIPIHPAFSLAMTQVQAREGLGIPPAVPVLFLSGGSRGLGKIAEVAQELLGVFGDCRILAATGNNTALYAHLKDRFRRESRLWAYQSLAAPQVKELMAASDLLVGKAGGLTISEALALGLPMLFFEPIPGQEAENAATLAREGAALIASSLGEVGRMTREALDPKKHVALRAQARALGRPDSAQVALDSILKRFASS